MTYPYNHYPEDLVPHWPTSPSVFANYRPLGAISRIPYGDTHHISATDRDKFEVRLDIHQFTPEEVLVKTVGGQIVVEGNHDDKKEHGGLVARSFVKKYPLPKDHLAEDVVSSMSSDGILTITSPKKREAHAGVERTVPITLLPPVQATPVSVSNGHDHHNGSHTTED